MPNNPKETKQPSQKEMEELHKRLQNAQGTLGEITGDIDALVISGEGGKKIFTLTDANYIYRKIIEEMNQGTLTITEEGLILYTNQQFVEMLKLPFEQVIGTKIFKWFGKEFQNKLKILVQKSIKGERRSEELLLNVSDGTTLPIYLTANKVGLKEMPATLCLMVTNLTEIKHKEKLLDVALQERQALLSLIEDEKQASHKKQMAAKVFEKSNEGIIIVDSNHNIILVNKAFTFITGFEEAEVLEQPVSILHPDYKAEALYEDIKKSINLSGHWEGEIWHNHKKGQKVLLKSSINRVTDLNNNELEYIVIIQDITLLKSHEKKIEWQAYHDILTGLPNHALLKERFNFAIGLAHRGYIKITVLYIDVDLFKRINDTFGHPIGDKLLIEVGKRLQSIIRQEDLVSRLGGDEFLILLMEGDVINVEIIVNKIIADLRKVFIIDGNKFYITVSIGIAVYPDDGEDFNSIFKSADMAIAGVKQKGRDGFQFSSKAVNDAMSRVLNLENKLYQAMENKEFSLVYQPQISLEDNHVIGVEALIRWNNPELGMVSPTEFIPLAERTGQIKKIGEWVLRTAVRQLKIWIDSGLPVMTVSVNVSASQFYQPHFCDMVKNILEESKVTPKCLELELTEGVFIGNPKNAIAILNELKQAGIECLLDDFGTGYSSLSYLKDLPFSKLKIDRSFVNNIFKDTSDQKIVKATIALAKSFGMKTVAEGAETKEQVDYLREIICDEVQGYYFAKPMSADTCEAFVKQNR